MKRLCSIIIMLSILLSLTVTSFAVDCTPIAIDAEQESLLAADYSNEVESSGAFAHDESEQAVSEPNAILEEIPEMEICTLEDEEPDVIQICDGTDFRVFDKERVDLEDFDISNAVRVFEDELKIPEMDLKSATNAIADGDSGNLPPVTNPMIFTLNPESLKDGNATTDTIFFLATRWNHEDLCYDPEGGVLQLVYNTSFPAAYIEYIEDINNDAYAGFAIRIFNEGTYPFVFAFADDAGNSSEIFSLQFDIERRGVFTSFTGNLSSVTDVKEYQITFDYSVEDELAIGILRTGSGGFVAELYNKTVH